MATRVGAVIYRSQVAICSGTAGSSVKDLHGFAEHNLGTSGLLDIRNSLLSIDYLASSCVSSTLVLQNKCCCACVCGRLVCSIPCLVPAPSGVKGHHRGTRKMSVDLFFTQILIGCDLISFHVIILF